MPRFSSLPSIDSPESTGIRLSAHRLSWSSSSSDKSYLNITSNVDPVDNFYNSEMRAGGPYLCSLPARTTLIDHNWYKHYAQLMEESPRLSMQISDLLKAQGMREIYFHITGRQSVVDPEHHAVPTVLIYASRKDQPVRQDWREIARLVYDLLCRHFPGINVEILDGVEEQVAMCFPVLTTDSIYSKWEDISAAILQQLDTSQWTSLQCYRYGIHRAEPATNPITVIVTVCYSADKRFLSSQGKIQAILASFEESTTAVVFLQDEFQNLVDYPGPADRDHNSARAKLDGAAISEKALPGQSKQYGITCFHCVYPPPALREGLLCEEGAQKALARWESSPVTESDTAVKEILQVDQPSVYDLQVNIDRLTREITAYENDQLKDLMRGIDLPDQGSDEVDVTDTDHRSSKTCMRYLDVIRRSRAHLQEFAVPEKYHLGHVAFGSGLHRTRRSGDDVMPSISDWALIQVDPKRLGRNNVYTYGRFFPLRTLRFEASRNPKEFQTLLKCGRSTRLTEGDYSGARPIRLTKERGPNGEELTVATRERSVANPLLGIFAQPGDAGSLVFNPAGDVVGMIGGGWSRLNAVFFQHILDVFDDVMEVTGAVEARVMF
ncbi:hypothetical protein P168DRAFT_301285 [Aspergillus campestris IBT 28561]|uniref:Uncharacterized protein n=1 Tax=Aspergillus campestris (strain IBT 28561) TaxID=1392248 RepID=A0A2I1DFG3_ASPC2|nr:uncharacterized protein P168DRAFT_301285 [Aspergillus campestris IBT 28561]PKY08616.1 hypothetical protein P168DRAFT_301285 [Aspergillus campestris IBT 28561]